MTVKGWTRKNLVGYQVHALKRSEGLTIIAVEKGGKGFIRLR